MGRIGGGLFALRARGQIGKVLVYSTWRGVDYVREYVIPANPQTVAQLEVRGVFSTLTELWKRMPTIARAPWTANATGRPYTDRNRLISDNVAALQNDAVMDDFVGSPGAGGGIPPLTMVASSPGALDINLAFTQPTVPVGWTHLSVDGMVFIDGDPSPVFITTPVADQDAVAPFDTILFAGLTAVAHQCRGWNVYTNANGDTVYSIALADQFTPTP